MSKFRPISRYLWLFLTLVVLLGLAWGLSSTPAASASSQGTGTWLPSTAGLPPAAPRAKALSSSSQEIHLAFDFSGIQAEPAKLENLTYTRLSGQDLGSDSLPGQPELPFTSQNVQIPLGATYRLEITGAEYREVSLADLGLPEQVYPAQVPQSKSGPVPPTTAPEEAAYASTSFLPAQPAETGADYLQRGRRGLSILLHPVQYNPSAGTLRIYSHLEVTLHLAGGDAALTRQTAERYASPEFEALQAATFLNYGLPGAEAADAAKVVPGYLIISADSYAAGLASFVTLKQNQGFEVTLATLSQTGTTNTAIQTYIQNFYTTHSNLAYLLLVGDLQDDPDTLPTWDDQIAGATHKTDLYYATLAGSDSVPDIGYGRFPVRDTSQLAAMVNKALAYESLSDSEVWIKKAAFLGSDDSSYWSLAEGTHNYVINSYTLPEGYTGIFPTNPQPGGDKLYAHTYAANTTNVMNSLNDGRSMVIYSGHGSTTSWAGPSVSQANVRAITSDGVYAFVAGHACQTGTWNLIESFAETWVIQPDKGALVYLGASDYTYWNEDDLLERKMFDALFAESQPSISAMTQFGLNAVASQYPDMALYYREEYHIFGDPSIKLRLGPQPDFSLAANPGTVQICSSGQGSTSLDLTSINGFTGLVDLSVTSKPDGITAVFNPIQVAPTGSSQLTLTDDGSTPAGEHTLTVQGTNGSLTHTADFDLTVNSAPAVSTLLSPADEAVDQWIYPTFNWEAVDGAISYTFELDDGEDFVTPLLQASLTEQTFIPTSPLSGNSTYYWRVKAVNECGETISSVYSFTTSSLPPLYIYLPSLLK